jgi:hypothetical protein
LLLAPDIVTVMAALLKDRTNVLGADPSKPYQPTPASPGLIPLTTLEINRSSA